MVPEEEYLIITQPEHNVAIASLFRVIVFRKCLF